MKIEIETTTAAVLSLRRPLPTTAPSLRVPVTTSNREKLRRLRAAEMFAWEAADRHPHRNAASLARSPQTCLA